MILRVPPFRIIKTDTDRSAGEVKGSFGRHTFQLRLDVRAALRVGTWNVRTLLEPGAARLLIDELEAAHIAIMGLQEVWWSDSGETGVGNYHLLWSGPAEGQPRQGGVALALNWAAHSALRAWFPVHSRLLVAKFQHCFGTLSIVVAYAPTNDASDIVIIIIIVVIGICSALIYI